MFNKDYENAKECLKRIYKPSQNSDLILPSIFILQKKFDEGRKQLQHSLKNSLAEATSFSWQLGTSYLNKDNLDIDRAIDYFNMAVKIRESEGNVLNTISFSCKQNCFIMLILIFNILFTSYFLIIP
ncbi:hypothetical protein [Metaclostridioides mangenotii]|uniref:hypothetical protein n=1 Tax=Metaclostridioides mangenotii TaxID=1540 RepID=UPI0004803C65|nr:hypothetical protein [Clostridioides mangenotii]